MKLKEGFVLREIANQTVVVATGKAGKDFNGLIKLNKTAKEIWKCLEKGMETEKIASHLTDLFEIEEGQAETDVNNFVKILSDKGFLE